MTVLVKWQQNESCSVLLD